MGSRWDRSLDAGQKEAVESVRADAVAAHQVLVDAAFASAVVREECRLVKPSDPGAASKPTVKIVRQVANIVWTWTAGGALAEPIAVEGLPDVRGDAARSYWTERFGGGPRKKGRTFAGVLMDAMAFVPDGDMEASFRARMVSRLTDRRDPGLRFFKVHGKDYLEMKRVLDLLEEGEIVRAWAVVVANEATPKYLKSVLKAMA